MKRDLFTPAIIHKKKIAFLHYNNYIIRSKHERNYRLNFEFKNFGAYVINDVLQNAGYEVGKTDINNANKYDIIFISLTSVLDMIYLSSQLNQYLEWKNRKFKVIAGGFGMQNYIPIHEYIDYAWFGRVENEIVWLIENNFDVEHPSLLKVGNHKPVQINQVYSIYDSVYNSSIGSTKEIIYGCPNKCFFCHYSFARKWINTGNNLYSFDQGYRSSIEVEQCKKELYTNTGIPCITTSIDGYSERLRFAVNKKITNQQIIDFFAYISKVTTCKGLNIVLYNISGFETETDNDYNEFVNLWPEVDKMVITKMDVMVQTTPLNPSVITPIAYAPVRVDIDYRKNNNQVIYKSEKLLVRHSMYLEGTSKLLEYAICYRSKFDNLHIFNTLISDKYLKQSTKNKLEMLLGLPGINDIIREYDIDEELPTQYVNSYVPYEKLKKMRIQMKRKLGL